MRPARTQAVTASPGENPWKLLGICLGLALLSAGVDAGLRSQVPHHPEPPQGGEWATAPVAMPDEQPVRPEPEHLGMSYAQAFVLGQKLLPLQAGLPRPREHDWRSRIHEQDETLHAYIASSPNRPSAERATLYVVQLGPFSAEQQALAQVAEEGLGLFYGLPVRRLEPLGLEQIGAEYRRDHDPRFGEQLYTGAVLALLQARRPADAVALLALTASDLWPGGDWNFVFGQASLEERVGVWSLARFGDPQREGAQVKRRVLQVALHETGHMLGLPHCVYARCGMNGSNSLSESDRNPVPFCLQDEMKVWWACPVEPAARYRALSAFAGRHGLQAEARFWARSAEALAP